MSSKINLSRLGLVSIVAALLIVMASVLSACVAFTSISAQKAQEKITENPNIVFLDVRNKTSFASEHIEGAINLEYNRENFLDILFMYSKDVTYIVYCDNGNNSKKVLGYMKEMGFNEAYGLKGGINAWKEAGYEVVSSV